MSCINESQIAIYVKFMGNSEAIEFSGTAADKNEISQAIWTELMEFQQRLSLRMKDILGDRAIADLNRDLRYRFCSADAIALFEHFVHQELSGKD